MRNHQVKQLAALARLLPGAKLRQLRLVVSPRTVLRWHADLVRWRWSYPRRAPGCTQTPAAVRALVLEMARVNPGWGYRRIHGELAGLGHKLAPSTVWQILKDAGIDPAPTRSAQAWRMSLGAQAGDPAGPGPADGPRASRRGSQVLMLVTGERHLRLVLVEYADQPASSAPGAAARPARRPRTSSR